MKKNIYYLLLSCLLFTACDSKLDIVPKGQVTLQKVSELELLLNQEFMIGSLPGDNLGILCGETVGYFDAVSSVLAQKNTCKYALLACDEKVNRAVLTTQDPCYNSIYRYVNFMNVVIAHAPSAQGDESRKPLIVAEARVMRAYLHWLAVSIYAKQYDPSTAAQEGGIAYSTSTDVMETRQKLSLQDSYDLILADLSDDVISQLPKLRKEGEMRGDQAWGNAVKAMVLMQMKRYDEALLYAQKAIALRPQMFDRKSIKDTGAWTQSQMEDCNFLYIGAGVRACPSAAMISLETCSLFEPGDYVIRYDNNEGWDLAIGESYSGLSGIRMYMGWSTLCNVWGLTSEQLHYVAAECLIRTGHIDEGLQLVDDVRSLRVEDRVPFTGTASTEQQAMKLLQQAKWLECIATPFNYFDVKRWNTEPAYQRTVIHDLGPLGTYTLSPQSPLWVQPFPANAVRYNPTLTQNF